MWTTELASFLHRRGPATRQVVPAAVAGGLSLVSFVIYDAHHERAGSWVALALGAAAVVACVRPVEALRRRVRVLGVAIVCGAGAVAAVSVWGDAGSPLLVLPAVLASVSSFRPDRRETVVDEAPSEEEKYVPFVSGVAAFVPAFAGGVFLIARHDLSGSGLGALLLTPFVFFAPTVTFLFDRWEELARARRQAWWAGVVREGKGDLHGIYSAACHTIEDAISAATKVGASGNLLDHLWRALEAAQVAYRRSEDLWEAEIELRKAHAIGKIQAAREAAQESFLGQVGIPTGGRGPEEASSANRVETPVDIRLPLRVPGWIEHALRDLIRVVAPARELNTSVVEAVSMYMMLWLRAGVLLGAPSLAYASFSPYLPHRYANASVGNIVWLFAAAWALLTALGAPIIRKAVMDVEQQGFRAALLAMETPIAFAVVIAKPSWPTALFLAGPVNWAQRPFHARTLLSSVLLFGLAAAVGVLSHPGGWTIGQQVAEFGFAIVLLAIVATSYGLMFPFVLRVIVSLPVQLLRDRVRIERKIHSEMSPQTRGALSDSQHVLDSLLRVYRDDKELRRAIGKVKRANRRVRRRPRPFRHLRRIRRTWTFKATLERGIDIVPPTTVDPEPRSERVYRWSTVVHPKSLELGELAYRVERDLTTAVRRIAEEADSHGEGKLFVRADLAGDTIEVVIANGVSSDDELSDRLDDGALIDELPDEPGDGAALIEAAVSQLPGPGKLVARGREEGFGYPFLRDEPVYVVRFSFDADSVQFRDGRKERSWASA